jgi:excisionase family DNA binding protein
MEPKLFNITELKDILKLHPKTILRFIHEGKIVARKIGRSWMVGEEELKRFCHAELSQSDKPDNPVKIVDDLEDRISVSAVVEINEQDSKEASRVSNTMIAMLNSNKEYDGKSRFDFFYYPEIRKAKYIFYGSPGTVSRILSTFEMLCSQKGGGDE